MFFGPEYIHCLQRCSENGPLSEQRVRLLEVILPCSQERGGQPGIQLLVNPRAMLAHQLPRNHGCHLPSYSPGPATHAAPSILAKSPRSSHAWCLVSGPCLCQGNPSLPQSCGPLDNYSPVSIRCTVGDDLQKEGDHDRCLQLRLGCSVRGQSGGRLLVDPQVTSAYQLPQNEGCLSGPKDLPASLKRAYHLSPAGQHNGGGLHQPPRRLQVMSPSQDDLTSPALGTERTPLTTSGSCAGQTEPSSGYVVKEQCSSRGMESTSPDGSDDLVSFQQGRVRPLRLRRQLSLPNLFFKAAGCSGPRLAQRPSVCLPSDRPATPGYQANQGNKMLSPPHGPPLEEPSLIPRDDPAAVCSTAVNTTEERSSLASTGQNLAFPARTVEPSCLATRRESSQIPARVTNTIQEARAPSTRHLYALKWSVFSDWCSVHNQDPVSCDVPHMLTLLQKLLDKGCTPSTLKVFVAAITANHSLEAGRTICKIDLFLSSLEALGCWILLILRLCQLGTCP